MSDLRQNLRQALRSLARRPAFVAVVVLTLGQTVPQMLMNLIDFGMDVQAAITAPRISFAEPDSLDVEDGVAEPVRQALTRLGHHVRLRRAIGNAHGLTIEYDSHGTPIRFTGGADPRGAGLARGLDRR